MAPIQPGMIWIGCITLLALILYVLTGFGVARMRYRHRIAAPAMTGNPEFERAVRVQANTLENLVPFLTALWLCAWAWAPLPAAAFGIVWLFGRGLYALGYYSAADRRGIGFSIGMLALIALIIGAGFGLVRLALVLG